MTQFPEVLVQTRRRLRVPCSLPKKGGPLHTIFKTGMMVHRAATGEVLNLLVIGAIHRRARVLWSHRGNKF